VAGFVPERPSRFPDFAGLDGSVEEAICRARAKADERSLSVEFLVKDAMTLGDWDERFASVIDSGLFHIYSGHNRRCYVQGLAHVIQPGGRRVAECSLGPRPLRSACRD